MVLFNAWFSIAQVSLILFLAFSMHSIKYNDFALRLSLLNMLHYYFLAVILLCHWSKHGHVTKIFCDIAIRKSVFHGVLTARSIHLFMTLYSFSIHSPLAPLSF